MESRAITPDKSRREGRLVRDAWVATGIAVGLVGAGMLLLAGLVALLWLSGLSARSGPFGWATPVQFGPLLVPVFPLLFGLVATFGAFGRFYGWG